ncbi:MAG: sulfatase-like hydrolase/transferase [Dehalococcoidia bacterium]
MTNETPQRPNIVFLLPDQLRADFLSSYGAECIETPNMDSLGEHGIRYQNPFSASPICVPARTALLTGMNAIKNGVTDNLHNLRPDHRQAGIRTFPEILNENGYYTAGIGKMHFYPWDDRRGFQYRVICEDKRWLEVRDDYYHYLKEHGLRKLHGNEHDGYHENKGAVVSRIPWEHSWDRFVGAEACRFIQNYGGDGPFAMMVGFPGPHCPYDPDERFLDQVDESKLPEPVPEVPGHTPVLRSRNIEGNRRPWNGVDYTDFPDGPKRTMRKHYAALVKQIDYEVGQVLDALREKGILDNTIVILASDHGDYLGDHNLIGKASFYESSIRVPLLVRLPDANSGTVSEDLVELRDVTATILQFAGIDLPDYMDARPLPGPGMPGEIGRDRIFGLLSDGWMNFDGRYKLHRYSTGEVLLFDMQEDPQEQCNLAGDPAHAETLRRLEAELMQEIMESMNASMDDRLAHTGDLSQDPAFGREGWQRPWPHPVMPAS